MQHTPLSLIENSNPLDSELTLGGASVSINQASLSSTNAVKIMIGW